MIKKDDYDLYFLNDLYDTESVNNLVSRFRNRLYTSILKGKEALLNNFIENGNISDIVSNPTLNDKYGMPLESYSLTVNKKILPFYSEKIFGLRYKFGEAISTNEIMTNDSVFSKGLYFYVNGYMVNNVKVVLEKDFSIIFIPIADTEGRINKEAFKNALQEDDGQWTLMLKQKSDYYTIHTTRNLLFNENRIYLSLFKSYKEYNIDGKGDKYTLFISGSSEASDLMISTIVILKEDDSGLKYFKVPEEFKNFIYDKINTVKVLITNEPNCTDYGYYQYNENTTPKVSIPFIKNPIPMKNLIVCKYDHTTKRELHPIKIEKELAFPNIYDFSYLYEDGGTFDLIIKWNEVEDGVSNYESYTQDYIDFLGSKYVQMKEDGTLDSNVSNYTPIKDIAIMSEDYQKSKYFGDYRAWKLDKLMTMLKDNPNRFRETFDNIMQLNVKRASGFSGMSKPGDFYTYMINSPIMNNAGHCNNVEEFVMYFKEPHYFYKIFNPSSYDYGFSLFVNGIKKHITYVMKYGSTSYIYFPASYISNNESILINMEIENLPQDSDTFVLEDMNDGYTISYIENKNSMSNIMICNNNDNSILGLKNFNFSIKLLEAQIEYSGISTTETLLQSDSEVSLYDVLNQLIVPIDTNYIVLNTATVDHIITNTEFHKKINLSDITIYPANTDVYLTNLKLYTTNFYKIFTFKESSGIDEATGDNIYVIKNYRGKQDYKWLHCFCDGKLINPTDVRYLFSGKYDGEVSVYIDNVYTGFIEVEYCGYDEDTFISTIGELSVHDTRLLRLDTLGINTTYVEGIFKIFIDGYIVYPDSIKNIGGYPMIYIKDIPFEFTNDSSIVIIKQVTDESPYDYDETSLHYMMNIVESDIEYTNYLIEKYTK